MSELQPQPRAEGATRSATTHAPATGSGQSPLKRSVRATEGYDAQAALLAPGAFWQRGFGIFGTADAKKGGGGSKADEQKVDANDKDADRRDQRREGPAHEGAAAKEANPLPPDLPRDFGSESVLRTWIGLFNNSIMGMKPTARAKWVDKLKKRGWGDDSGLNYELLAQAAAKEPAPAPKRGAKTAPPPQEAQVAVPGPVSNARILAMLSKGNQGLLNGIEGYSALCLQFSVKMMEEIGAKRADGSDAMGEKRGSPKGSLTPLYRGKPLTALPKNLPAGFQICVVSRPEWGFTEVGNHWFISAGDGFYLDNVMGVTTASQMVASLKRTTAAQWLSRVIDPVQKNELRNAMGEKFAKTHGLERFRKKGRKANEKKEKLGKAANPDYKAASQDELAGVAAVQAVLASNEDTYRPRIWVVEPTTRADGGQ